MARRVGTHLASPSDRGKKPGLHGAFERPLGSGPDPLNHRHPARPEPVHPRQHRVRRQGAAQHAAGPVPGIGRPTHGAAGGAGPTARPASGKAWSRRRRSTRCARSTAGRRAWRRSSGRRSWWSTATSPSQPGSERGRGREGRQDIDVLINSSGRVTFNPPLESALRTNVEAKNVLAFAKRMRRPALIHTSTCFVAGNRSGEVWEERGAGRLLSAPPRPAGDDVSTSTKRWPTTPRARRASASWPMTRAGAGQAAAGGARRLREESATPTTKRR